MAINLGKPVYVFDQLKNKWFKWENTKFVEVETPILTSKFAGIGTREINEKGKQAIRNVYEKTFNSPKTLDDKKVKGPVRADSLSNFKKEVGLKRSEIAGENRAKILAKVKKFNKEYTTNYSVQFKRLGESTLYTFTISGGPVAVQAELDFVEKPAQLTMTQAEYSKMINDIERSDKSEQEKAELVKELNEAKTDEEVGSVIKKFCK